MTRLRHLVAGLALAGLTASLGLGTGCIGAADIACRPGEICECDGIGACHADCVGGDCAMVCDGTGACDLDCPDGGCAVTCRGEGACQLSCPGGDCEMTCRGAGACEIRDCDDGTCDVR